MEKKNYILPMTETHEVRYRSILALSFQIKDQDADPETEMLSGGILRLAGRRPQRILIFRELIDFFL